MIKKCALALTVFRVDYLGKFVWQLKYFWGGRERGGIWRVKRIFTEAILVLISGQWRTPGICNNKTKNLIPNLQLSKSEYIRFYCCLLYQTIFLIKGGPVSGRKAVKLYGCSKIG